jgi:peroxiredoxin (alkyl hydroperoxide reductase subunit C)
MRASGAALTYDLQERSERVLTVGDVIPEFRLPALAATVGNAWEFDGAWLRGRWVALLYWPRQTCVESPEDAAELMRLSPAFGERDTQFLLACAAIDANRAGRPSQRRFTSELPFPVLFDVAGLLAGRLGLDGAMGRPPGRATFVADPAGVIRWTSVSALPAVRNLRDAAQALDALRGAARPAADADGRSLIRSCAWCRRLQDEGGWHEPEIYIRRHSGAELTHGICGECLRAQSPR